MPVKTPHTKAEKSAAVHQVMHEFKHGKLRSGSKSGPVVKSVDQAKAIAMSESGQSKKKYDRSSHQPGNPGFNREGAAPYRQYNAGAHASQPSGNSIGNAPEMRAHTPNQTYAQEQAEHGGNTGGSKMGMNRSGVANIDKPEGSSLLEKCGFGHASQPSGKSIGAGSSSSRLSGSGLGGGAHTFRGMRSNPLRMSGHSGAHRIGKR